MLHLMIINLINGKDIKVHYSLKTLLMNKIDRQNKLMIIARGKWISVGQNNANKH